MPNPSIEDVLREYDREQGRGRSSGSSTSWGDYIFGDEASGQPNILERGLKVYRESPILGKPFGWADQNRAFLDEQQAALEKGPAGKWGASAIMFPERVKGWGAEALFGSPADAASTVASLGAAGLAKPVVKKVAGKYLLPAASKALSYTGKALGYTGRGLDATQAAVGGATAYEQAKQGNYGAATLAGLSGTLGGWGATGYRTPWTPGQTINIADLPENAVQPNTPAFMRSDPKFAARPVTRPTIEVEPLPGKTVTIEGTVKGEKAPKVPAIGEVTAAPSRKAFKTEDDYLTALVEYNAKKAADTEIIRASQEPLRYTHPVETPTAITDPARLLPEKSGLPVAPPSDIRPGVVHPRDVWLNRSGNAAAAGENALSERAIRDLTAAGEEVNARNMERYLQIDAYRSGIQGRANAAGKPGGYEATVASDSVTPAQPRTDVPLGSRQAVAGLDNQLNVEETLPDLTETAPTATGPVRFKTERGSTYEHFEDGTTVRNKAARPEHPGDEGIKDRSSKTYYVDPDEIQLLDALATRKGKGTKISIRERQDGTIGLWYESGATKGFMKHHRDGGFVTPSKGPEVGKIPVEVFEDGSHHFGNKITEVGEDTTTWRANTATEKPYRYGDDPKLDGKMKSKVQRVLNKADKELADITDPAERRLRLVEMLGENLTLNELGAAFEGRILNSKLVREASTNRISRGIEESAMVPRLPEQDVTPNIGPANNMPPPGFAGRAVEAPTATGPMYWNQQSPAPIDVTEGTFAGGVPTTPPQVSGLRQVMAEPGLASRPVMRTEDDVIEALHKRGVTQPSPEMVQKILSKPDLLDAVVPPASEFVPDVSRGFTPVNRPVEARIDRLIPERVPVQTDADRIMTPEQATAAIEKARAAKPRDIYADNDWERAQEVMKNLGHEDLANAVGAASNYVKGHQLGLVEDARKSGGMSMETELQRMGEAGDEIVLLKRQANADANRRFSGYIRSVADEVDALSDERFTKVAEWLDGDKAVKLSAAELATAEKMKEVLKRSGQDQVDRGMLSKGAVTEYWPRRWDGIPEKTIEETMRAKGLPDDQIQRNLEFIRKNREMKTAGEYNRSGNDVPGFRLDKDVFFDHLKAVSTRVELADRFGLKDTADPNSTISKLISQTSNPERARNLAERMLRGGPTGTENSRKAANVARNYAQSAMLQLSAISNLLGGATSVGFRGDLKSAGEALFKVFQGNSPEMKFMKDVNRFNEFRAGLAEGLTDSRWTGKLKYGINSTQNQINKYAGATGLGTAKALFQELKAKPKDKDVAWLLQDLVHERPATLLKQGELTPAQLERAMYRMADLTQGFMQNEKLPYAWVRTGLAEIPQIFQRINFMVSKTLKDGVMHSPTNRGGKLGAVAKLGALGIGLGEAINVGKEIPRTAGQVGMNTAQQALGYTDEDKDFLPTLKENLGYGEKGDEANRYYQTKRWLSGINKKAGDNEHLVHAVNNLESSFAVGMPLNLLAAFSSTFLAEKNQDPGGTALNNMFVAVDEGGKLLAQGVDTAHQILRPLWGEESDFRDTARFVTRRLPIVGGVQSGVVREIDSSAQSKRSGSSSIWGNPEDFR